MNDLAKLRKFDLKISFDRDGWETVRFSGKLYISITMDEMANSTWA